MRARRDGSSLDVVKIREDRIMAQGVASIGGAGNFNDPANWSSDFDGDPAGSPTTPPGADMRAEYLVAGTVSSPPSPTARRTSTTQGWSST